MELPTIHLPPIQTKYKVIAIAGISALLFGLYFDHAYKPHAEKITELENELLALKDTIQIIRTIEYPKATNDAMILKEIERKKNDITSVIVNAEKLLPSKNNFSTILEKITYLAYESGFDIKAFEPKDLTKKNDYHSMSINMEIEARFINLLNFLEQLKTLPIYLESIQINTAERPNLAIRLNLSILAK